MKLADRISAWFTRETPPAVSQKREQPIDADMDRAAMRLVNRRVPYITENNAACGRVSEAEIDSSDRVITELTAWSDGLPDGQWRESVQKWINVCKRGNNAARDELKTGKLRARRANESAGFRREDQRADDILAKMPLPPI
jgi:hypothetical protein